MPKFNLTYSKSVDFIIEAPSKKEAMSAAIQASDEDWIDDNGSWDVDLYETRDEYSIDMGVIDGVLLSLWDYERDKAKLDEAEAEKEANKPDPNQLLLIRD